MSSHYEDNHQSRAATRGPGDKPQITGRTAGLKALEIILDRAWRTEGKADFNIDPGAGTLRIEIIDPQSFETITIDPNGSGHNIYNQNTEL
jgi:hypothetical protein